MWQHLGVGQGFGQAWEQAQRSDVGCNIAAVLLCEMLARGAPSWPRQNCLLERLEAMCCQLLFSAVCKSQPNMLVLAGGHAGREVLPCWGEDCCDQGSRLAGRALSPAVLP